MGGLVEPLDTQRLSLVPCSYEASQAAFTERAHLESLLGDTVPEDWPDGELRDFLPIYARQLAADPDVLGWGSGCSCIQNNRRWSAALGSKANRSTVRSKRLGKRASFDNLRSPIVGFE